jgi:hypothetical protein
MLQQRLLDALDKWSNDQSIELTKWNNDQSIELFDSLAEFAEQVVAAVAAFAMLESSNIQEPPNSIRTRRKIMRKLKRVITAKDIRVHFAAISGLLQEATTQLHQAVSVIDEIDIDFMKIAEPLHVNVRYVYMEYSCF